MILTRFVEIAIAYFVWKSFPKASDDEIVAYNKLFQGVILDPLGIFDKQT